ESSTKGRAQSETSSGDNRPFGQGSQMLFHLNSGREAHDSQHHKAVRRRCLLTAASDDDEGVTLGDDVKSRRRHDRPGWGIVMVSRPSSCCRGLAGMAAPAVVWAQPLRIGARSCPRAIIAMICHGGAVGPSLRTEAAAAVARADMASASAEPAGTITGSMGSNVWAAMVP